MKVKLNQSIKLNIMSTDRPVMLKDGKEDYQMTLEQHMKLWCLEYALEEHKTDPSIKVEERAEIFYNFLKGKE